MYAATILADTVGPHGVRLTTVEATYPRAYHAELMTHRDFSRNSESSRAIPTEILIERAKNNPYIPVFRERVKGMGAGEPLKGGQRTMACGTWLKARDEAVRAAERLLVVAKDQANRVLEPFLWHTAIYTATEWQNFFNLRVHPAAAEPVRIIAAAIQIAREESEPKQTTWGGWHLPLVTEDISTLSDVRYDRFLAEVSAGRCARSSYSLHKSPETVHQSRSRWDQLSDAGHWSPGEHPARCVTENEWDRIVARIDEEIASAVYESRKAEISRMDFIGNFRGYVQLRKHYEGEAVFNA